MLLIRNANIKTMAGPDLKNGCLLLENGKIAAVGQTVDAPEGVETLDAQGRLLTPAAWRRHCHIGLDNEGMRWEGMDYNEVVEPLTPQPARHRLHQSAGRGLRAGPARRRDDGLHRTRQRKRSSAARSPS